ncbi:hypothetical protein [Leptolyngbya sp. PL-A3]
MRGVDRGRSPRPEKLGDRSPLKNLGYPNQGLVNWVNEGTGEQR